MPPRYAQTESCDARHEAEGVAGLATPGQSYGVQPNSTAAVGSLAGCSGQQERVSMLVDPRVTGLVLGYGADLVFGAPAGGIPSRRSGGWPHGWNGPGGPTARPEAWVTRWCW